MNGGLSRLRVGIKPEGKVIAREGTKIFSENDQEIGLVTSGTFGPSINRSIAMGYVKYNFSNIGNKVFLEIRGKKHVAKVSEDLTGSRYVSTDAPYIDVRFSKLPGYELLFDAHSCTLELDVDLDFFKKLAKEDNFKAFERAFINASASTFYQA